MSSLMSRWPLSKTLLLEILADRITDRFVARLVWERLGYESLESSEEPWVAGKNTPLDWLNAYPIAPEVIAQRKASVKLTRSIPNVYKQLLKQRLNFKGYRIGQLYPRRTRRATVLNWLLAWHEATGEELPQKGPLPELFTSPIDPVEGHPGDLPVH